MLIASDHTALAYAGTVIQQRHEMLSLTDMWKASGGQENREPFNWARFEGKAFIEAVSIAHNLSETQVMTAKPGKGGGTFAHWQIALAYAKYLSPEFHMWCNTVVRERMEGRTAPEPLTASQTGGIVKAVANASIAAQLTPLIAEMRAVLSGFDPSQIVVSDYQPMLAILQQRDVGPRKRRQLSQRCSSRCKRWLITQNRGADIRLSRETKRYLFQVVAAAEWMQAEGNAIIADHLARVAGQAVMQFRPRPALVPSLPLHPPGDRA